MMAMHKQNAPTNKNNNSNGGGGIFQMLANTPRTLRRKLGLKHGNQSPKADHSYHHFDSSQSFSCRYLGELEVATLDPTACYEFAARIADETRSAKSLVKGAIAIERNDVRLMFATPTSGDVNKLPLSPNVSDCSSSSSEASPGVRSRHVHEPATTVFVSAASSSASCERCEERDVRIPIHEIAYCVTHPALPHVFLLTARNGGGGCRGSSLPLVCRAFVFSSRHKSQRMRRALARHFQSVYLEWQTKYRLRMRRRSQLATTAAWNKRSSTTDDDDDDDATPMHREFVRRESTIARPEVLDQQAEVAALPEEDGATTTSSEEDR